jgi:hypothetical protein
MIEGYVERNEKSSDEKGRATGSKNGPITRPEGV